MNALAKLGPLAGYAGMAIALVAALVRLGGRHHYLGFEILSFFLVGIGLMVAACVVKLYQEK